MLENTLNKIKKILIENCLTVATGESCTGGLVCSYLTDIDGASEYIKESYITYSNASKQKILNVKPETIKKYGVYSHQTAKEMCIGLLEKNAFETKQEMHTNHCPKADIGISTTGIAGPAGGSEKTPVGTVFVGIGSKNIIQTFEYHSEFQTRIDIKKDMAVFAIKTLLNFLDNNCKNNCKINK